MNPRSHSAHLKFAALVLLYIPERELARVQAPAQPLERGLVPAAAHPLAQVLVPAAVQTLFHRKPIAGIKCVRIGFMRTRIFTKANCH
jgi:hypothetical protein